MKNTLNKQHKHIILIVFGQWNTEELFILKRSILFQLYIINDHYILLQIVVPTERIPPGVGYHTSVSALGTLQASQHKGQSVELITEDIEVSVFPFLLFFVTKCSLCQHIQEWIRILCDIFTCKYLYIYIWVHFFLYSFIHMYI